MTPLPGTDWAWTVLVGPSVLPVHDHHLTCFTAPVGGPSYDALHLLSVPCPGEQLTSPTHAETSPHVR